MTHILQVQNTYDESDCGVAKGERTYTLKAQSRYDGSDHIRHAKER